MADGANAEGVLRSERAVEQVLRTGLQGTVGLLDHVFQQVTGGLEVSDLLEEVISKADGALKSKAQGMLDRLA